MMQGNSPLSLSVRVSKKPINVEVRVSISKCLTYIAQYFDIPRVFHRTASMRTSVTQTFHPISF